MAKNDNLKDFVTDIADAIREKKGTTDLINPQNFSDEILSIEAGGDIIDVDTLPTEDIDNDKIYKLTTPKGMFAYIDLEYGEFIDLQIPNYIYVSSINDVTNPMVSEVGTQNTYVYVDTSSFVGYIFLSETERKTLSQFYNEFASMNFVDRGKIDTVEDAVESGIYFIPQGEETIIGVPDINCDKGLYKYNGFNWEYLVLNKYDVAGKWQEIPDGNVYEFKIDGKILVDGEYNYLFDNYKIIDNKVYMFDMDGNPSEPLLYIKSEDSTNLARLDNKNFVYNKIEDFKADEKTLDYDQASGVWYASSLDDNGRVESIMYYVLPLLQDENGKRNVKVYSADAEGFTDSTTEGMTYYIDGNQVKLQYESGGEISDAGSFGYEVIDNKVHLTMDGEVVFTKIVTGLGKNDNGQLVSSHITQNGLYNGVTLNDPEALYFSSVIDVKCSSGGGASSQGKYFVKVIDYDGTVLKSERLDSGATFTLPEQPTHAGLIFQSWSCSQNIIDNTITISNNNVFVGATYTTASGMNEFDIELTKPIGLDVTFQMAGTKDWGDGTIDDLTTHTYTNYGKYTIKCNGTTMPSSGGLFGQSVSLKNYYCVAVRLNSVTTVGSNAFINCYSLRDVIISNSVVSINSQAFQSCKSLNSLIIPQSVTSVRGTLFKECPNLKNIVLPGKINVLESDLFSYCYSLESIVVPEGVSSIYNYAFSYCTALTNITFYNVRTINNEAFKGCYVLMEYDFSKQTIIPTLSNTNVFEHINKKAKIIVPDELYDKWITSTNWSAYADYIYKASELV